MYLLDTMVLSERGKRNPDRRVIDWLDRQDESKLLTSVLVFGEIASGIEKKRTSDPVFSQRLAEWSGETQRQFRDRTLTVTTGIALRWGGLVSLLQRRDMDLLIAATALEHDLVVVTRNIRHFEPTGAKLLNPYEA